MCAPWIQIRGIFWWICTLDPWIPLRCLETQPPEPDTLPVAPTTAGPRYRNFITARDGTTAVLCGRYATGVQAVYNAVFLATFARHSGKFLSWGDPTPWGPASLQSAGWVPKQPPAATAPPTASSSPLPRPELSRAARDSAQYVQKTQICF